MKKINLLSILLFAGFLLSMYPGASSAQSKNTKESAETRQSVANAIHSQNFIFNAQSILPSRGGMRQLNGGYDLQVQSDEVTSFLPYMGRIYAPIFAPSDGPLRFTSTNFDYEEQTGKKGGWSISIKPKDVRTVQEMILHVSEDGYTTLMITGKDRQSVTFYGYIRELA